MEEDFLAGNKVLLQKKCVRGAVYMIEMPNDMVAVVAFSKDKVPLCSRSFIFTDKLKKEVMKSSRTYFRQIQDCLYKNNLEKIEELDFE